MVIDAFSECYDQNVKVRALVFPPFFPEYAVGIKKEKDDYKVFHLEPELQYNGYIALADMKNEYTKVLDVWNEGTSIRN